MPTQRLVSARSQQHIHNSENLEIIQMSTSWWMDKCSEVCPYKGILFSNRKEWITGTCYKMDEPKKKITLKEARCKDYIYNMIPFTFNIQKRQIIETESRSVITWGWGWELVLPANNLNRLFRMITIFWNWIVAVVAQHYKFIKNN